MEFTNWLPVGHDVQLLLAPLQDLHVLSQEEHSDNSSEKYPTWQTWQVVSDWQ